jgi:septal ring factor EnvC (AmiA/AmiB activator)
MELGQVSTASGEQAFERERESKRERERERERERKRKTHNLYITTQTYKRHIANTYFTTCLYL